MKLLQAALDAPPRFASIQGMKSRLYPIALILVSSALLAETSPLPVKVGVSVLPLESVVEDIGGPLVDVQSLQQEGDSCSVFEPRPSRIRHLAESRLFFRTGVGYESTLMETISRQYPDLVMIDLREGMELIGLEHVHGPHCAHGHAHVHEAATDPHIWVDPIRLRQIGERVAAALIEIMPEAGPAIQERLDAFTKRLDAVHEQLSHRLKPAAGKSFYIYHPALGYFADRYNLRQVAIGGDSGSPKLGELRERIGEARRDAVVTVFIQPQESRRQADILARAVNAGVKEIDPMHRDWEENLMGIGEALAEALVRD